MRGVMQLTSWFAALDHVPDWVFSGVFSVPNEDLPLHLACTSVEWLVVHAMQVQEEL